LSLVSTWMGNLGKLHCC